MKLSSGKELPDNGGCYALSSHGEITYGYDGIIDYGDGADEEESKLSDSERLEVCDAMIRRWQGYRLYLTSQNRSQTANRSPVEKSASE